MISDQVEAENAALLERLKSGTLTWVTPARAREIWENKGPFGEFKNACTPEEDAEIRRVWLLMPGHYSWISTLLSIANSDQPQTG